MNKMIRIILAPLLVITTLTITAIVPLHAGRPGDNVGRICAKTLTELLRNLANSQLKRRGPFFKNNARLLSDIGKKMTSQMVINAFFTKQAQNASLLTKVIEAYIPKMIGTIGKNFYTKRSMGTLVTYLALLIKCTLKANAFLPEGGPVEKYTKTLAYLINFFNLPKLFQHTPTPMVWYKFFDAVEGLTVLIEDFVIEKFYSKCFDLINDKHLSSPLKKTFVAVLTLITVEKLVRQYVKKAGGAAKNLAI